MTQDVRVLHVLRSDDGREGFAASFLGVGSVMLQACCCLQVLCVVALYASDKRNSVFTIPVWIGRESQRCVCAFVCVCVCLCAFVCVCVRLCARVIER